MTDVVASISKRVSLSARTEDIGDVLELF